MRKALIVWGGWAGHTPKACAERFAPWLREQGFDVEVSTTLDAYLDSAKLSSLNLIVPIWTMGQMCEHMGAATPGFTAMALNFHHTADTIGEAARRGDRAAVLAALDRTLQTCVGCHATYRQEIVDEATWKRLTAEAAAGQ